MNQFHVGQDVICVDAKFDRVTIPQGITEGQVYRLRWVGLYKSYVDGDFLGVRLEGVERGVCPTYGHDDPPFAARRFRPLVNNPMQFLRELAKDPDLPVQGDEGPVRGEPLPDDGEGVEKREREVEEV